MNEENLYPVQMPVSPAFPVPPMPPSQRHNAHHGRVENCARRAHEAIMRADWPARVYADDVFAEDGEEQDSL